MLRLLRFRESRPKTKATTTKPHAVTNPTTATRKTKPTNNEVSARTVRTEEDRMLEELADFLESEDGIFTP
jgi:hypothetical protein